MERPPTWNARGRARRSVVWTARFVGIAFGVVLAVGVAEVALRMGTATSAMPPARPVDPEARDLPAIEGIFTLARPNQRVRYRGALYTTNSRGVRGPEMSVEKRPGTFRIAVVGDSYTMGSGVRLEEAYPALLEANLNATGGPRRFEVLNFGLSGLSLEGVLRERLERHVVDFNPDLLVYGFTVNDLEGEGYSSTPRPRRLRHTSVLAELLHVRWDHFRDLFYPSPSSYVRELDRNYFENPVAWDAFEARLDRLAAFARERKICVVVLIHTELKALHRWHPFLRHYEAVAGAARKRGMHVVDTFPYFEGLEAERYWCAANDPHPAEEGHRILAEALAAGVRRGASECLERSRE